MSVDKTVTAATSIPLVTVSWSNLQLGQMIGSGGYGDVYRATWQGIEVAVKQLHLKTLSTDLAEDFQREVTVMAQCQFPHVVRLYGVCQEPGHTAMVMEYLPKGSLYQVLHDSKESLPWNPVRWNIAIEIGKGLSYLHLQKIIHRDLKSLNVLLDNQYHAKITDFGLAKIKLESNSTSTKTKQGMGTTRWRAPELFKRNVSPNVASDVYSYGMVLWEIASRQLPFSDASDDVTVMGWIKDGEQEKLPTDCPESYGSLVQDCWKVADQRPTAEALVSALEKAKPKLEVTLPETKPYVEKSWHFDPETKAQRVADADVYKLIEATDKDKRKALEFYQHHPVPGYEMASVRVIYNPSMNHEFALYMSRLQQRDNNPAFTPKWPTGQENFQDPVESPANIHWRTKVHQQFKDLAKPYQDSDYPAVNLLPMWHGTKAEITDSIFRAGYAALATTDSGFFGRGIYSAHEAEYSYRVYAKQGGALILNWVACFSAYPVIDGDMNKFVMRNSQGLEVSISNYSNYDAHFVPVVPAHPLNPNETDYYPTKHNQPHTYTELVVSQTAACLPRYLVELQPTLVKAVPPSPSTGENKPIFFRTTTTAVTNVTPGEADYQTGNLLYIKFQYKASLPYFEKAAKEGYPAAYLRLQQLYKGDLGVPKNEQKQQFYEQEVVNNIHWFQSEAKKGGADAQTNLARCYASGLGVTKDLIQAAKYYRLAADQGDAVAQNNLGWCYQKGDGVIKDLAQAVKYYQLSANQGNRYAQKNLGVCYQMGDGVEKNVVEAVKYYRLAADQGDAAAQSNLGWCYQKGKGVAKDLTQAMQYYQLAADQGYEAAKVNLKNLLEQHPHLKYQQTNTPQTPFFSSSNSSTSSNASTKNNNVSGLEKQFQ